jgi:hypothetical protein
VSEQAGGKSGRDSVTARNLSSSTPLSGALDSGRSSVVCGCVCCVRVVEELKSDADSVSMRIRPPLRDRCCLLIMFLCFTPQNVYIRYLSHSLPALLFIALHSLSCHLNRLLLDCTSATQGHSSHAALHAS